MRPIDAGKSADGQERRGRPPRLPYEKPEIVERGRLVEVALGGSPGAGDSGSGAFVEDLPTG